jgi:RNA polymerase sigma factor (TIGR02999 family)
MVLLGAYIVPELLNMARTMMRSAGPGHTLQPTALVNEVAVKMLGRDDLYAKTPNRIAFFAYVTMAMRSVLVDHARRRATVKRPNRGQAPEISLESVVQQFQRAEQLDLLALDEALQCLKSQSTRQHDVVVLRFFGGLNGEEIASYLGVSRSTVDRDWSFARA